MNRLKFAAASLIALTLVIPLVAGPLAAKPTRQRTAPSASPDARAPQAAFGALAARYLDTLARLNPVAATGLGDHRFDALLPDVSARGRAVSGAAWRALLGALHAIPRSRLSR